MAENLEILNTAVSLLIKAALLAARFSGRVRQRYLNRLASRDVDAKAREILFLKDRVYQLEMQLSILQKQLTKKGKKPRYEVGERLLILWHIEAFQIPRRKGLPLFRHRALHALPLAPQGRRPEAHRRPRQQDSNRDRLPGLGDDQGQP